MGVTGPGNLPLSWHSGDKGNDEIRTFDVHTKPKIQNLVYRWDSGDLFDPVGQKRYGATQKRRNPGWIYWDSFKHEHLAAEFLHGDHKRQSINYFWAIVQLSYFMHIMWWCLSCKSQIDQIATMVALCIILCYHGTCSIFFTLQWRHNERHGISYHGRLDWLLNHLLRCISKKTSKLWVIGLKLWAEFTCNRWIPHWKDRNAENISIWWRHHAIYISWLQLKTLSDKYTCRKLHIHNDNPLNTAPTSCQELSWPFMRGCRRGWIIVMINRK